MALWGKTDATISKPKYLSEADAANAVFISTEEAVLKTNKDKGITGGGWWLIKSYTDSDGNKRFKSELLVAMAAVTADSGDAADDTVAADVEVTITVGTQPANQTTVSGGATFGVTATVSSGTLTYQWQKKPAAATGRWANVSGATSATVALTGQLAANAGDQYRVVLGSSSGAAPVTSSAATLAFGN